MTFFLHINSPGKRISSGDSLSGVGELPTRAVGVTSAGAQGKPVGRVLGLTAGQTPAGRAGSLRAG